MKARLPENFTDVGDVKGSDHDGILSRSMTIKARTCHEGANSDLSCCQTDCVSQLAPEIGAPLHEERVRSRGANLHHDFYQCVVTTGGSVLDGSRQRCLGRLAGEHLAKGVARQFGPCSSFGGWLTCKRTSISDTFA